MRRRAWLARCAATATPRSTERQSDAQPRPARPAGRRRRSVRAGGVGASARSWRAIGYGQRRAGGRGRYGEAFELPRAGARRVKRSMEAPEERFAALLGGRDARLASRGARPAGPRADLDAGRPARGGAAGRARASSRCWRELADMARARGARRRIERPSPPRPTRRCAGELSPTAAAAALEDAVAAMEARPAGAAASERRAQSAASTARAPRRRRRRASPRPRRRTASAPG